MFNLDVDYDFLAAQGAAAQETAQQFVNSNSFTITGTASGQLPIWNGTGYVPGSISGDSNGVSVGVVSSPAFGLQVTLAQNLKTTASPTFAGLTVAGAALDPIATRKSNLSASVAPTVNDDSSANYSVGSFWCDTTADDAYICLDASVGAAVWKKITP